MRSMCNFLMNIHYYLHLADYSMYTNIYNTMLCVWQKLEGWATTALGTYTLPWTSS